MAMVETGCVMVDEDGSILAEYEKRLHAKGQPGTGDQFYLYVLMNQQNKSRVRFNTLSHARGDALRHAFASGTLKKFDLDDRPFAMCAAVSRASVVTCTDSDWSDHETGLAACSVRVEFACGRAAATKPAAKKKSVRKR